MTDDNRVIVSVIRRNNRISEDTLMEDIYSIWENSDADVRDCAGVPDENPQNIYRAFDMVSSFNQKNYGVRSHRLDIFLREDTFDNIDAWTVFEGVLNYYAQKFQCIFTMTDIGEYYRGSYLINSVSYIDGMKFLDNNQQYAQLGAYIQELTGYEAKFTSRVLFTEDSENYER